MTLSRFINCQRGNMAMILAICMVPLIVGIGAAVDYSRTVDTRERMQHSLDAAVLALSDEASKLTAERVISRAQELFDMNYSAGAASGVKVTATYTHTDGAVIEAKATGSIAMTFMNIVGIKTQEVGVTSKSAWSSTRLRVALALDNTGSMAYSGKMTALKTATNNLIDKLSSQSTTDGDIYVSIVPFNRDVNVGVANKNAAWLYWDGTCLNPSICTVGSRLYSYGSGDKSKWKGCVVDRNQDLDISVSVPTTDYKTKFYVDDYSACPSAITPLTNTWTTLKSSVSSMVANGSTNQTIGLVWAWQSLKSTTPLDAPAKDSNFDYLDAIILLSDGDNTQNRWTGDGKNSSWSVDDRMSKVCSAAKADGITIYTVLVVSGNASVLRNCASSADNYFNAASASDIITAFGAIGDRLSALRIAK